MVLTRFLQGSYTVLIRLLQGCYKVLTRCSQCFTRFLQGSLWFLTRFLQTSYKILQGSYTIVTRFLLGCYKVRTRFIQGLHKVPTRFLQGSHEVPTRFLQGSENGSDKVLATFFPGLCNFPYMVGNILSSHFLTLIILLILPIQYVKVWLLGPNPNVKRNLVRSPSQAAHSFCLRRVGLLWSPCGQCTKTILGLVVYLLGNSTPQCENEIKWTITGTNQQKPWRNDAKQWKSSYCGSDRQKEGIFYKHESIHFFN